MTETFYTKRWAESDWATFKEARLEALATNPSVFLDDINLVSTYDASYWQDILRDTNNQAIFGLYADEKVIGLTAIFRYRHSPQDTAITGMSFIRPDYRGKGLSDLFYEARIGWAKSTPDITKIIANHRKGNVVSQSAILKWGFVFQDIELVTYGDGKEEIRYAYLLELDKS